MSRIIMFSIIFVVFSRCLLVNSANLLNSYLPASMQALAYYIDHLQYEPVHATTVEPPFSLDDGVVRSTTTTTPRPTIPSPTPTEPGAWNPPAWWTTASTTTGKPLTTPTPPHRPGLYAPESPDIFKTEPEGYDIFYDIVSRNPSGFDDLPLSLIRDIITEPNHDDFNNDVESLDNFLRLYDDNYGRAIFDADAAMDRWSSTSTAGKKRVPPTKPYVEFLLVYDLLKRDAKSLNLSKYEGYSEELLNDLYELSHMSSSRQLYSLFRRMLDRGDIQRSDVVSRIQAIAKDLGDPESPTVKALQYIPAMPFLP